MLSSKELDNRDKVESDRTPILPCDACGKTFQRPEELRQHIDFAHLKGKRLFCDYCGEGCTTLFSLYEHINCYHHWRYCALCSFKTLSLPRMQQHCKAHAHRFCCPGCDYLADKTEVIYIHQLFSEKCSKYVT